MLLMSGRTKLLFCVHLLIYSVQIRFMASIMMKVFNESFRMYLLSLVSKTWDQSVRNHMCTFLHKLKIILLGDCKLPELIPGLFLEFIDFSFW